MSVDDTKRAVHSVAEGTELQATVLSGAYINLQALLIELGELLVGSDPLSPANEAYTNVEIAGRCLKSAIRRATTSTTMARAYAESL